MSDFRFEILACDGRARRGRLHTAHGPVETPCFMPVGTLANVKTLTWDDVRGTGASMVLANTYHLYLRPGHELIRDLGGLHRFTGWEGAILTDSGGFQVYSLSKTRKVHADGVEFRSHLDGSKHYFTPELVMEIQDALGVDVAMAFDECCPFSATREYAEESLVRTHAWARRSLESWPDSAPGVPYGIVQGAFFEDLRRESVDTLASMTFPGLAIGGLAVGEPKTLYREMLDLCAGLMPTERPRYLMGVGYPQDLVEAVGLGVDQFDCVLPTRNARKGMVFTSSGPLSAKAARYARSDEPVDGRCDCRTCATVSRAYLRHLFHSHELLAQRLATLHNVHFYQALMAGLREAIEHGRLADFQREFARRYDPEQR